jgi:putative phosphoribosyl transferase
VIFNDRREAGHLLSQKLRTLEYKADIVVGLIRGGVVVADEIACEWGIPLVFLTVKKLPSPRNRELAVGAVAPDGVLFIDQSIAGAVGADEAYIRIQIARLTQEIQEVNNQIGINLHLQPQGKTVILTDDGVATGATVQAAVKWLHVKQVQSIILAIPVMPLDFMDVIKQDVSQVVTLEMFGDTDAVGGYYRNFEQISTEHVIELMGKYG